MIKDVKDVLGSLAAMFDLYMKSTPIERTPKKWEYVRL